MSKEWWDPATHVVLLSNSDFVAKTLKELAEIWNRTFETDFMATTLEEYLAKN
jgi:hypothetical protein